MKFLNMIFMKINNLLKKIAPLFLIFAALTTGCAKSDDDTYHDMLLDGVASLNLGKAEKALREFNAAINFNPRKYGGYLGRGNAFNTLGRYNEAIRDYNRALSIDTGIANAYVNRGIARVRLREYKKAVADFEKGLELDPEIDDPPGFMQRLFDDVSNKDKGIRKLLDQLKKKLESE